MRGFEVVSYYKDKDIIIPRRSTKNSAGYDFFVAKHTLIKSKEIVLVETGIKAYMEDDEVLQIYARSSLSIKKGLMLPNSVGIIDSDYYNNDKNEGHIFISMYNFSNQDVLLKKGEKFAQGIFVKYLISENEIEPNDTRKGGFGSTDNE